jgi:Putative Ig domain
MAALGAIGRQYSDSNIDLCDTDLRAGTRETLLTRAPISPATDHGLRFGVHITRPVEGYREAALGNSRQINGETQVDGVSASTPVLVLYKGGVVRETKGPTVAFESLPGASYEVVVHGNSTKRSESWGPTTVANPSRLVVTGSLAACSSGVAYSSGLTASGGYGAKTWDISGALPSGLSFSTSTGLITGTTAVAGTYKLCIGVTVPDNYRVFKNVTLTVT